MKSTDSLFYMAPELLRGELPTTKSDIWALGVLLYEICNLKRPFSAGPQLIIETKIK